MIGVPALVIGLIIYSVLIMLLFRGSAKAALLIAFLAVLSVILISYRQTVMPMSPDVPRPPTIYAALLICTSVVAAFCSFDLWSQWRRLPNQSTQPPQALGPRG